MQLNQLIEIMKKNGIAGAGGAGFPSYAKLDKRADTIILNCAECEPLLKLHRQVLEQHAYEILSALTDIAEAVEAAEIVIAIKPSYRGAVNAVKANLDSFPKARIGLLPESYPSGDEVITIYETTGRVVPPGNIPISVGVTVFNVETVYNVYQAIHHHMPVHCKYVTVTGAVKQPVTLRAPIGIALSELVSFAGGAVVDNPVYICGGPMTGNIAQPYDPVTKTTNAVLVLPKNHYVVSKRQSRASIDIKRAMSACCQCRMCTDLCPRNLLGHPIEPHAFMRAASSGSTKDIMPYLNTMFCSTCGLCEFYACPQNLSPRTLIGTYKAGLRSKGVAVPKDVPLETVKPAREYRKIPNARLVARLGLAPYNVPAPLKDQPCDAKTVKILLRQHIGTPATAVVKQGEQVQAGQLLADVSEDKLGIPVHASIDGVVTEVNEKFIIINA